MNEAFFNSLRSDFGPLSQNQVDGINHLLSATENLPINHRAYILATAFHETGPTSSPLHMTPRREIWGPTAAQQRYEGNKALGNTQTGDGKRFMGRGYVQITGRANYQKASNVVGRDLIGNPDLALDPDIAAKIIVSGMTNGWFTGKKLSDYSSYYDMRRIVNGTDKADLIASYAMDFERAIKAGGKDPAPPPKPDPAPTPPPVVPDPVNPPPPVDSGAQIAKWLIAAAGALFAVLAAWMVKG